MTRDHLLETAQREIDVPRWWYQHHPDGWLRGETHVPCERDERVPCPECGDQIIPDCYGQRDGGRCDCERQAYHEALNAYLAEHKAQALPGMWVAARVPPRHRESRFQTFEARDGTEVAVQRCRSYAEEFKWRSTTTGLYLVGMWGSGKTHLAVATAAEAMSRTLVQPLFVSVPSLLAAVKAGDGVDMGPANRAAAAELLVLDDIGQAGRTEFDRETIYNVVNSRYESRQPTIYTSNVAPDRLQDRLGGALVSRLHETTEMVVVTADDFRRKGR